MADVVSNNNPFLERLMRKGNVELLSGGYEIVEPLDFDENQTYQRYSGYDVLNISASDVLTAAKYPWVQAAVHVTCSGLERRNNSGKEQIIKLVKARMKNAERTAKNNMSVDVYSDGTLDNQIGGLAHIVPAAGTGNVGGIDSSTYTQWQSQVQEFVGTPSSTTVKGQMNALWLQCVRGNDKPDLIVSSHDYFAYYWASLQDLQRYGDVSTAGAGFSALKYNDADVIFDTNSNFSTTAQTMFFLNTDYLKLQVHRDANWSVLPEKISTNQDAEVVPIIFQGNMTCSNRALQGRLVNLS
jgi:hypothetical protein